jgi:hypothetical protein
VILGVSDSVVFDAVPTARRCAGGHGVVLEGATGGNGILVWIRAPGAVTPGTYPVLPRGDSTSPRGAVIAARYLVHEAPHGFSADTGSVTLLAAGPAFAARLHGRGIEVSAATRPTVDAELHGAGVEGDSIGCSVKP